MEKSFEVRENGITLRTALPLLAIIGMKIGINENEHGKGKLEAVVRKEYSAEVLRTDFSGSGMIVEAEDGKILFNGFLETAAFHIENGYTSVSAELVSRSILFDREKKCRSFQKPEMTYEQIMREQIKDYEGCDFLWKGEQDCRICFPVIQYEETDWEFIIRLASHFHTVIYPGYGSNGISFCLGKAKGKKWQLESQYIIKWGIGESFYSGGCYEGGRNREGSVYTEVKGNIGWDIGDVVDCEGIQYMVFRKKMIFEKGETICTYLLGKDDFIYKRRKINKNLRGNSLAGTVRKSVKENIWIQLDMDKEEKADYPWPWVPETGNLCYCMPETGTKVMLYFPSGEERDGIALHVLRKDGECAACNNVQNRELHTVYGMKAGLYPNRMFMEGKDGMVSLNMKDGDGICLDSGKSVLLEAAGKISINGRKCMSSAPMEILYQTSHSNIEICRDFNFYAPGGVQTNGKIDGAEADMPVSSAGNREPEHWQISYSAMAAVPVADVSRCDADSVMELAACSAVPKIAGGRQVLAMKDTMEGKTGKNVRFPDALQGMEIFTVKGGHRVPGDE